MKRIGVLVLPMLWILTAGLSCSSESEGEGSLPPPEEEEYYTIRVMAYNIFHGEKTNGKIDMDRFAEIINDFSPDLVALQEVDVGVERSGGIDIPAELSERTDLDDYFFKHRNFQGGDYGNAILSKLPIVETAAIAGYKEGTYGVTFPFAKVELDEDTFIYFNTSHFSTDLNEREVHAQQLADYYETEIDKFPLLICGDLNAEPDDPELEVLFDEFAEADTTLSNTFSTRSGMRKKIDFILYPDNPNWEVLEFERKCPGDASDHCAIFAVLRYKKS